jgi:hypothetical protein
LLFSKVAYQGIPIGVLMTAIALNAIPSIGFASVVCSSADKLMERVSTASHSAIRVLGMSSCMKPEPVSALSDDWVTVDALEFETGVEV